MKKPWVFIRVPYMNPVIWGFIRPKSLNQVPTLGLGIELRISLPDVRAIDYIISEGVITWHWLGCVLRIRKGWACANSFEISVWGFRNTT